jgi:type II secretory pathway component PulJ
MNNYQGFSLFECLLYLSMSMLVITQLFEYVVSTQQQIKTFTRKANASLSWLIAHDILLRDLITAPSQRPCWLQSNPAELFWVCSDGTAYKWYIKDAKMIRVSGIYDAVGNQWKKSTKSTVAENMIQFSVNFIENGNAVRAIILHIQGKNDAGGEQDSKLQVALRNKVII